MRRLPLPAYRRVLDACCGRGRHARELAAHGYRVLGVDLDAAAVAEAARLAPDAEFRQLDVRELRALETEFDAAISLGQTFGLFDADTNAAVLAAMRDRLRPGGRIVLDVFDRRFVESAVTAETGVGSTEPAESGGAGLAGAGAGVGRLRISLDAGGDAFEWLLYTPDELRELAGELGLDLVLACSGFSEAASADGTTPRFQVVLERPA
jgi:SAM-dependent methyltransferase